MLTLRNVLYLIASAAWVTLFWSDVPILINEWNSDDYSHCYLILPIVGYLVWTDRDRIARTIGGGPLLGILFSLVATALFYMGRFGSLKFFVYLSMWLSLCGMALLFLGSKSIRSLWMPMLVGFFAVPLPAFITKITSLNLRLISSVLSEKMLQVVGIPVYREGNIIDLGVIQLQVVDACSGLRYLWPSLLMALLVGWFFLPKAWKRVLLILIAIPVTILSNSFRIALTGVLTKFVDPSLAEGFFHDFSGWLVYVLSLGMLGLCAMILKGRRGSAPQYIKKKTAAPVLPPSSVWTGIAACCFMGVMVFGQYHLLQVKNTPERMAFTTFPAHMGQWQGSKQYLSKPVMRSLGADDYLNVIYTNPQTNDVIYLLVSWYDHQTTNHAAHAPTSCLVGGGWDIRTKQVLPAQATGNRSFPVTQMTLDRNGTTIISNFWFLQRGKVVVSEWLNKWHLLKDAIIMQRTDGALVRLEMPVPEGASIEETQQKLNMFADQLRQHLTPYLPDSYENGPL